MQLVTGSDESRNDKLEGVKMSEKKCVTTSTKPEE